MKPVTRGFLFLALYSFLFFTACGNLPSNHQPQFADSETWYGAYLGGQRVGYMRQKTSQTDEGGLWIYSENFISAKSLGKPVSMRMIETLETTPDLKPKTYFQKIDAGLGNPYYVRGKRLGSEFRLEVESDGKIIKNKSFDVADELTFPQLADLLIRTEDMAVGKHWIFKVINPADFLPIRIDIRVDQATAIVVAGVLKRVLQVSATMGAVEMVSYVDTEQRDPYKIDVPSLGMSYVMEDKQTATQAIPEADHVDFALFSAVIPTGGIPPPNAPTHLRVRLTGANLDGLDLSGNYQQIVTRTSLETVLDIQSPDLSKVGDIPSTEPTKLDTLMITPTLQALALRLKQATPIEFSRGAMRWMQENIRQVPTSIVPTPSEVLELKQGDCNEFSALFHALANAAGFKSKISSGLVYMDGRYFYHSWNEIKSGKVWIPIDPIFNEIPASTKHIKLIEGDFSASWKLAGLIRNLQIQILPD